ncbi:nitrate/nitrite transporter [Kutzneria buriramensis]|uniref:Sugar phosphate permease n=1 Tax=Kutzneria buriramensis TaxID=1045776 RepID=A0A3E0H2K3_9PSEU|nr:MFS transporter [Kutzneria buriramensis]REH37021.1 sugar phosphate permease [Kutzneria buriramensis]
MAHRWQLGLVALVQVLVLALWFSASAVAPALRADFALTGTQAVWLTATVQVGFAVGAVVSALANLADRIPPNVLITLSALLGAAATATLALAHAASAVLALRLLTGISLAGVYPPGMKIVVSWFPNARGVALGLLVGALSVGSAAPQLINGLTTLPWRGVLLAAALLAVVGAAISLLLVRSGPAMKPARVPDPRYVVRMFHDRRQRLVNLGYFGHMWELYALWSWLPTYLVASHAVQGRLGVGVAAFLVAGVCGLVGCLAGGYWADRHGRAYVAMLAMLLSAASGLLSTLVFDVPVLFLIVLAVWGATVIADSAQFSAALTEVADQEYVGTALTAQTAIGFLVSVLTIQALPVLADQVGWRLAVPLLAIGPLFGAAAMARLRSLVRA